jgi:superfamily II DNA/RNA helicase
LKKAFDYIEDCSDKQFVLSGSVLPYAATSPDPLAILKKEFSNLQVVSSNDHNLIPSVKTNFISISDTPKMKLLESILESTRNKKVVIFCNHVSRCSDINDLCKSKNLNSYIICPHLHFEDRLWSHLQSLQQQESILVTNELGCRGFDMQADHVILYNLPLSLSSLVNKLGVLKKEGQGEVTFILEAEEEKIKEQFQPGEDWNKLFSFYSRQGAKKVNSFFST